MREQGRDLGRAQGALLAWFRAGDLEDGRIGGQLLALLGPAERAGEAREGPRDVGRRVAVGDHLVTQPLLAIEGQLGHGEVAEGRREEVAAHVVMGLGARLMLGMQVPIAGQEVADHQPLSWLFGRRGLAGCELVRSDFGGP